MKKKSKKYKELDLQQSKLKSTLHTNIRLLLKFKHQNPTKNMSKSPISMSELKKQESTINRIRKKLKKDPITLIKDLNQSLTYLR